jgi:hypothetical protein
VVRDWWLARDSKSQPGKEFDIISISIWPGWGHGTCAPHRAKTGHEIFLSKSAASCQGLYAPAR